MSDLPAPARSRASRRVVPAVLTVLATLLAVALTASASSAAGDVSAQAARHYYVLIPGSCDPGGRVYDNPRIDYRGGTKIKVAYPASAPGACGTLGYDASVAAGVVNARAAIENAYRADPGGVFVVVGYSQGAQVANLLLDDIAERRTAVPPGQVRAKLYADPMQPFTSIGATIPRGWAVPFGGYVSPGPGRGHFGEIPFLRYCITTDGVCDNRSPLEAPGGYFAQHFCYEEDVMWTIADGVYSNATHFWPRVDCKPPYPAP